MQEKIIGYTTGVFDMFHIGHLNLLRRAKERCDYLIVGVSTDELVRSYKKKSPIIPFEERLEIIRAIKYVDEAIPQVTMDKMAAWEKYHFRLLFHGSDWQNSPLYDKITADFKKVGTEVVFLPHTVGVSSTLLSEVLQKMKKED